MSPDTYLAWPKEHQISVCDELRQRRPTNQTSDSVSTKERDSLLKLVIGMAIGGYRYDPQQTRNAATREIQDDVQTLGLSIDAGTVLKYLKQGAELVSRETLENINCKPNSDKS